MITCKEVVDVLSTEKDLSFRKKIELRTHLFMCEHCSAYYSQMNSLKNRFKKIFQNITKTDSSTVKNLEKKVIDNLKQVK